jgi:hypothetical protein
MATRCPNGHEIPEGGAFCPVCGVRLNAADRQAPEQADSAPAPVARPRANQSSVRRVLAPLWDSRGWKGRTALVLLAVVVGVGLLGAALGDGTEQNAGSSSREVTERASPQKKPPKTPRGYRDLFIGAMTTAKAAKPLCEGYRTTISNWFALTQGRLASSRGADADSYAAANFQRDANWLHNDHTEAFKVAIYRASRTRLRAVTRRGLTEEMIERFSKDALSSCHLRSAHRRATSAVVDLDMRVHSITTLAASLPWYPRGFYEWDDNVAWRWVDDPYCDYFTCWQMRVTTRDGCPSGLYAEINIKRGGTVVDYSNDALGSLGPGETALLEFTDTSESGGTGFLTEINCY